MALDKQRILSELGSVVNQLQSADCGCMSKLFNDGGQVSHAGMNVVQPGAYRHGCCSGHRNCNPCAGEPHSRMPYNACLAPKLFSDTYGYLANNVMQPAVKEVYEDLKSLNQNNTIMNPNLPFGAQQNMPMEQGNIGSSGSPNQHLGQMMAAMNKNQYMQQRPMMGYPMANQGQNNVEGQMMNQMPGVNSQNNAMQNMNEGGMMNMGMGPQIAKMMSGHGKPQNNVNQGGQPPGPMTYTQNSPYGRVGVGPPITPNTMNGPYESTMKPSNIGQGMMHNPMNQYAMQMGGTPMSNPKAMDGNLMNNISAIGGGPTHTNVMNSNPSPIQQNNVPYRDIHGPKINMQQGGHVHAAGIRKFNQMFPVQQDDLGFDPMSIAVQMNPANQRQAAMEKIKTYMERDDRKMMRQNLYNQAAMMPSPQSSVPQSNMMQDPRSINPALTQMTHAQMSNQMQMQNQYQPNQSQQLYSANGVQQMPIDASGQLQQQQLMQQTNQMSMQNQMPGIPSPQLYPPNMQQLPMSANVQPQQQQLMPQPPNPIQPVPTQQGYYSGNNARMPFAPGSPQQQLLQQQHLQQQQLLQLQHQQQLQLQQLQQQLQQMSIHKTDHNQSRLDQNQAQNQVRQQVQNPVQQQVQNPVREEPLTPVETIQPSRGNIKATLDPIIPSDINPRNLNQVLSNMPLTGYNTLGQPVQYLPANMFRRPDIRGPQTLSPSFTESVRYAAKKYSNVKLTESKTNIIGNSVDGKTPSRNTLQHIYNQYRGSHSFTQQNIPNVVRGGTASDGKLRVVQETPSGQPQYSPVEKDGGDTALNAVHNDAGDSINNQTNISANVDKEQIGDVPVKGEKQPNQEPPANSDPILAYKIRNGIQDQVYTTANAPAPSWTFHGEAQKRSRTRTRPRKYRYY